MLIMLISRWCRCRAGLVARRRRLLTKACLKWTSPFRWMKLLRHARMIPSILKMIWRQIVMLLSVIQLIIESLTRVLKGRRDPGCNITGVPAIRRRYQMQSISHRRHRSEGISSIRPRKVTPALAMILITIMMILKVSACPSPGLGLQLPRRKIF